MMNKDNLDPDVIKREKATWHENQQAHSHDQNSLLTELLILTSRSTNGVHGMFATNHQSKALEEKPVTEQPNHVFQVH